MTLTDTQEILVILFGGIMFLISFTWTAARIRAYMIRRRRPRGYRPIKNQQPEKKPDEEDKPPVDCQWG